MAELLTSSPSHAGWEEPERPRCKACRGLATKVLVVYGDNQPVEEWECVSCGKVIKIGKRNNKQGQDYKKKRQYHRRR